MRHSLCLCDEEKRFIAARKPHVMAAMQRLLKDKGPKHIQEVSVPY